ncbi:MAG: class I SAM-dependent methyltransferase [Nanoarchaeota archaeon]|nr:class I SAM-dependent methyltransferase [Nanoarchaeota archaeon]
MVRLKEISKEEYYYDIASMSREEMEKFLKKSNRDWKKAVKNSKISGYMKDMILNEKVRGKLAMLLEKELKIPKTAKVLDIGAGMGALTLALARKFNVSATDANLLSLKFVKQRAEQEKVKLKLYKTSPLHKGLPFKKSSFDVVIMNGVLEWVAYGFEYKKSAKNIQESVLKNIFQILRKDGIFVLAIENRVALDWFRGKTSHMPVKYIDLLPRKLADVLCRIKLKQPFRTYIYTKYGYKKLLKNAGFRSIDFYEAQPNYQKPKLITKSKNLLANSYIIISKK